MHAKLRLPLGIGAHDAPETRISLALIDDHAASSRNRTARASFITGREFMTDFGTVPTV